MGIVFTQSLPASDLQTQFMEPYVSKSLNRKLEGIVPVGVYRGYTPSVPVFGTPTMKLLADVTNGDSIAVCNTVNGSLTGNFFNTTVYHSGDIVMDLTAVSNGTYSVVLEAAYDITSPTPLTGITAVTIKLVTSPDLLPQHVILTKVTKTGPNLTLDNSTRMDNLGPLVTLAQTNVIGQNLQEASGTAGSQSLGALADITGTTVNFTLASTALVHVNGHLTWSTGNTSGSFSATYYINIDGTDYVLGEDGDTQGAGVATTFFASFDKWKSLTAGSHTAVLRAAGNGTVSSSAGTPSTCSVIW